MHGRRLGWFAKNATMVGILACSLIGLPALAATVPGPARNLVATASPGYVDLSWQAPESDGGSPIDYYYVQYGTGGEFGSTYNTGNRLSAHLPMPNGTTWNFRVFAGNAIGRGALSNVVTATPSGPPDQIGGLAVQPGDARVIASWSAPHSGGQTITGYTVTANPSGPVCKTSGALTCTITGLTNGTAYSFVATATSALGTSVKSAAVSATPMVPPPPGPPAAPTGLAQSQVATNQISLIWKAPLQDGGSAITGYRVTASPGGQTCTTTGITSCTVTGLPAGANVSFTVAASNSKGWSAASAALALRTSPPPGATAPAVPTNLTAVTYPNAYENYVDLNWQAPASGGAVIVGYLLEFGTGGAYGSTYNPGDQPHAHLPMTGGVTYDFRVSAFNDVGRSAKSTPITILVKNASMIPVTASPTPVATANGWTQIGAGMTFTSASIGSASNAWGTNAGGQIQKWAGTSWTQMPGAAVSTAVGADGAAWVLNSADQIYRWNGSNWSQIPGALRRISVGNASNVWGANAGGQIYKWTGTSWTQMPGAAVSTAVGADGAAWVLNSADEIYRWNGSNWTRVPGALRWISVGGATNVWGVNAGGSVYKFNTATGGWDMPVVPSGPFIGVTTAADGTTLLLRKDGTLWKK